MAHVFLLKLSPQSHSLCCTRLFGSKAKHLSKEEMEARKEEESIFSDLPELPTLLSTVEKVTEKNADDEASEDAPDAKKRRIDE